MSRRRRQRMVLSVLLRLHRNHLCGRILELRGRFYPSCIWINHFSHQIHSADSAAQPIDVDDDTFTNHTGAISCDVAPR